MSGIVPKELAAASTEEQNAIVGALISGDRLKSNRNGLSRPQRVVRLFQTVRHLTVTQACHWAARRTLGRSYRVPVAPHVAARDAIKLKAAVAATSSGLDGNKFDFLNRGHDFGARIEWSTPAQSRLWLYNLHYFDFALDPSRRAAWIASTIQDWIAANPPRESVGWEPYPVSLRVVNWIKFDLQSGMPMALSAIARRSLYQQVWWLERNLEIEIQANHLLKNAKALLFGGAYFAGAEGDRWLRKGKRLFLAEAEKQFLADGGHYERSAMYHAIALEDVLDVLSLAIGSRGLFTRVELPRLIRLAATALAYLRDISFPAGRLPMFNDSAAGIAPDLQSLVGYARAILPSLESRPPASTTVINRPRVGFFGYRHENEMMLIDAGSPAPSYQPGHSHCSLLSFELMIGGRPLIVDSGVHDYEDTPLRYLLRSTQAHNTVRIDREEQSDIWGAFRMGRRARCKDISLEVELPQKFRFSACHDGYTRLAGAPAHRRTITCAVGRQWQILDEIAGQGRHHLECFLHLHPEMQIYWNEGTYAVSDESTGARYRVTPLGGTSELLPSVFCPRFGVRQNNTMLKLSLTALLPATLGYVIEAA
jgi:uncharacterized heparinase superfamily protein